MNSYLYNFASIIIVLGTLKEHVLIALKEMPLLPSGTLTACMFCFLILLGWPKVSFFPYNASVSA